MSDFKDALLEIVTKAHALDKVTASRKVEIADLAERIYNTISTVLPKLEFEGYAVAVGHGIEDRARVKGPGVKMTLSPGWDHATSGKRLLASGLFNHLFFSKSKGAFEQKYGQNNPESDENTYKKMAEEFVVAKLLAEYGPDMQAKLDSVKSDAQSLDKAQGQTIANRQRGEASSKKAALERLAFAMSQHNYTEEEVIEAWQISQVRRVMES